MDGKAVSGPAVLQQQRGRPDCAVSRASKIFETRTPRRLFALWFHDDQGAVQTAEAGTKSRQLRKLSARSKGTPHFLGLQRATEHA